MQALLYISHEHLITLVIPAPCLADALARLRDPEQQARLFDLVKSPMAKVALYRVAHHAGISKAELGRRLGWHAPQVDRLFDLNHNSRIEQIDQALRSLGKQLVLSVRDAA